MQIYAPFIWSEICNQIMIIILMRAISCLKRPTKFCLNAPFQPPHAPLWEVDIVRS